MGIYEHFRFLNKFDRDGGKTQGNGRAAELSSEI